MARLILPRTEVSGCRALSQAEIVRHSALMIVEEGGASDDPIPPLLPLGIF